LIEGDQSTWFVVRVLGSHSEKLDAECLLHLIA
jgi:hypothetical protein